MLTPLQLQIRLIVASLPDTEDLALAGGGALIVHGIVDRETRDLDFFSNSPEEVDRLLPSVEKALRDNSLVVERLRVAEGFAQLSVTSASETTTIDLAWDPRLLPSVEKALRDNSLVVERLRVAEGFAQLSVTSASETTTIELAWDPRLLPPTVTPEGAGVG